MAVRYPKNHYCETIRGVQGLMNVSAGSATLAVFQNNVVVLVAPSRYSNVRKVIFSLTTGKLGPGSTMDGQLQIGTWSSSAPAITVEKLALPVSTFVEDTPDSGFVGTNRVRFSNLGPQTTIVQAAVTADEHDQAQIMQIEFDRFNAGHTDFFAAWDAFDDDDDYMALHPFVSVVSSDAGGPFTMRFKNLQCTVVQAPGNPNNSNTDFGVYIGTRDDVESTAAFQGAVFGPRHIFRYIANDWDNITGVSVVFYGSRANSTLLTVRVFDQTASAVVFDETFALTGVSGNYYVVRTQDFLASLIDGHIYQVDYRHNAANGSTTPRGNGWISVIQKGFQRTVTIHNLNGLDFTPATVDESSMHAILFDPLWYEDFPDERILKRRVFSNIIHNVASNNPRQIIRVDTNLLSDDSARAAPTAVDLLPEHTTSGAPGSVPDFAFQVITANDPIDLAGQRKLTKSFPGSSVWTAGIGDFPGGMGLYYALNVPLTDVPELGPLFALDAFVAEGCAATAAGLGDPGILVITNGATLPQKFNPIANLIEDNGVPEPLCDEVPSTTTQDMAISPEGGLGLGIYRYRYTFRNCCTLKESNPNDTDIVVDTSGQSPAGQVTISFADVRIPGDPQICEICLYRTILGGDFPIMAKVGCLDVATETIFIDQVADSALDFVNDGLSLLNAPMPCVPVVAEYRNRLFGMGDIPQLSPAGTVSVVNGSDTVTGSADVEWTRCLDGKYIQIQGDCRVYEIDRVCQPLEGLSPPLNRLILVDEYEGPTDTGLNYTICGRPNRLYFSEPLEPECWPEINFLDIEPGDGDRLMGAVSNFNRLIICKRNKTYVLTFNSNPLTEVIVPARVSSDIGCIGPRTFAQTESGSVWLADRGVANYDGRAVSHVPESAEMNDIFINPDNPRYVRRDRNGRVIDAVGVFYPKAEQYLLLLPTVQTDRGCNLMLVWDVKLRNVTLLEFCQEFQSMVVGKDSDGNERVYMGDTNGFVWIYDIGGNDGAGFPNATGTLRGTVTASGVDEFGASFFDDETATFLAGGLPGLAGLSGVQGLSGAVDDGDLGLAGICVFWRAAGADPDVPWQQRVIFASTPTRIYVTPSWVTAPTEGDEYMIGPIEFRAVFKIKNYGQDDDLKRQWSHILVHEPETVASELRVELRPDFDEEDPGEPFLLDAEGEPVAVRTFDLSFSRGRQTGPTGRELFNFLQVVMSNFAPEEPIRVLNHDIRVTPRLGG
jgi:hypothetical protein